MELVGDILSYFLEHPRAADTAEGITRWRLLEATVSRRLDQTRQALAFLVARGFLRARASDRSLPLFELDEAARPDAESFLQGRAPEED